MTDEPDKLDNKDLKAEEEAKAADANKQKEEKGLSEEDKKAADLATEKKISKEEAKKEVAREEVKQETGYSAESLADVGRTALTALESMNSMDKGRAASSVEKVKGKAVEGMLEKMTDHKVAKKIIQAGLGSEFTSTNESGLEHGAKTVLDLTQKFGSEKKIEKLLADAALYGVGLTMDEIKNLTPEKLEEKVNYYKEMSEKSEAPEEKTNLYKGLPGKNEIGKGGDEEFRAPPHKMLGRRPDRPPVPMNYKELPQDDLPPPKIPTDTTKSNPARNNKLGAPTPTIPWDVADKAKNTQLPKEILNKLASRNASK